MLFKKTRSRQNVYIHAENETDYQRFIKSWVKGTLACANLTCLFHYNLITIGYDLKITAIRYKWNYSALHTNSTFICFLSFMWAGQMWTLVELLEYSRASSPCESSTVPRKVWKAIVFLFIENFIWRNFLYFSFRKCFLDDFVSLNLRLWQDL